MKKVFLDTNIILDVMTQREPFNVPANAIMKMGIEGKILLCATPLTFANCTYILRSSYKLANSINIIKAYKQLGCPVICSEKQRLISPVELLI